VRGSGERLHGMQEVTGSIPVFSTRRKKHRTETCGVFLFIQTQKKAGASHKRESHRLC